MNVYVVSVFAGRENEVIRVYLDKKGAIAYAHSYAQDHFDEILPSEPTYKNFNPVNYDLDEVYWKAGFTKKHAGPIICIKAFILSSSPLAALAEQSNE